MTLIIFVMGMMLQAQQKKYVTPEDYGKWSYLVMKEISSNGEWVSYGLRYETAMDTLFVKQTETNQEFSFPNSLKGSFSRDGRYFVSVSLDKRFSLLDLDQGKIKVTENIVEYGFSNSGKYLYTLDQDGVLLLNDLRNKKTISRQGVIHCVFDPQENNLAFVAKNTVGMIYLKGFGETRIADGSSYDYQRLTWHVGGKSLAFLGKSKEGKLEVFFYDVKTKQLSNLVPEKSEQFPENMEVVSSNSFEISQNGDRVFLDIRLNRESDKNKDDTVQIWYSNDKELFPWKEARLAQYLFKRSVWIPQNEEFKQLEKMSWSRFVIGPNQKYALAWDIDKYKPSFAYEANADIYLVDLRSGKEKLVLENFGAAFNHWGIHWSPGGRYLSYFKNLHWWVYDIVKESHSNVTKSLEFPVHDLDYDYSGLVPGYGNPGWSPNDGEILVYDEFDVWAIGSNGKSKRKLTNGRERGITFRLYDKLFKSYSPFGVLRSTFDISKEVALTIDNHRTKESGYGMLRSGVIQNIVYGDFHIDFLRKAKQANKYVFRKQKFDLSPQLILFEKRKRCPKLFVQSNLQQKRFYWSESKLLHYTISQGKELQGALFYPANYNPNKKYPMVVNIYEKKSSLLHRYQNPSNVMEDGFNPTNFVNEGYFVLYPDIFYETNNPGISAVDCVLQAVKNTLNEEPTVDKNRVGLIGHSFGGYQTAFIITQTDMFATAIAGAPITDLVSHYLGIGWNTGKSHAWRFEHQQIRYSGPYYEQLTPYILNSPIHTMREINTPLLLWFGDKDGQIDYNQGFEMYNSMRRMGKKSILLIYPNEGHVLSNEKNKLDYTKRILDWFGFYLKNETLPNWMNRMK